MTKIRGQQKVNSPKPLAQTKKAEAKPAVKTAKPGSTFPRSGWSDQAKLTKTLEKAQAKAEHPRLHHARPKKDPISAEPTRPPIAMRYGLPSPHPAPQPAPPIAMRYGLPAPHPGPAPAPAPNPAPPIAMRYGLPAPHPAPPIAMRYGLPAPHPGPGPIRPDPAPPIAMRYGLVAPQPRPGVPTTPRRGHGID